MCDGNTYNVGYIGSRATGSGAGDYLVVGPDWKGATPPGIKGVFRSTTQFALAVFRTQLFGPDDIANVARCRPATRRSRSRPSCTSRRRRRRRRSHWPRSTAEIAKTNFFDYLDFALQFAPPQPNETAIRAQLATIGVGPGRRVDSRSSSSNRSSRSRLGLKEGERKVEAAVADGGAAMNGWRVAAPLATPTHYQRRLAAARGGRARPASTATPPKRRRIP